LFLVGGEKKVGPGVKKGDEGEKKKKPQICSIAQNTSIDLLIFCGEVDCFVCRQKEFRQHGPTA
jgi:hypothetical protein